MVYHYYEYIGRGSFEMTEFVENYMDIEDFKLKKKGSHWNDILPILSFSLSAIRQLL